MQIAGTGIATFNAGIKPDYKPLTTLALKWVKASGGNWFAADRSASADTYEADIRMYGTETKINQFIGEIEDNRAAGSHQFTLSGFASTEHIFGADVDHSGNITATVVKWGDRKQESWKGFSVRFRLRAISPSFVGSTTLPAFEHLVHGYIGDSVFGTVKDDTYNGTMKYTDKDNGAGVFAGTFIFSDTSQKNFRRYAASQRDSSFSLTGINGVTYPFGIRRSSGYPYTVKLLDWEDQGMRTVQQWMMKVKLVEVA